MTTIRDFRIVRIEREAKISLSGGMFEMNKHDYLVDNVNSKSPVDSDHEVRSTQMCSYQQDESTENCSFKQCGAC